MMLSRIEDALLCRKMESKICLMSDLLDCLPQYHGLCYSQWHSRAYSTSLTPLTLVPFSPCGLTKQWEIALCQFYLLPIPFSVCPNVRDPFCFYVIKLTHPLHTNAWIISAPLLIKWLRPTKKHEILKIRDK